ncbi:MAG: alanine racemase [Firmicutes bacterium]|nr:alanine racemase [Bacillota bacterium]
MNYTPAPYPLVECRLDILRDNVKHITNRCHDAGVTVAGVVKGVNGKLPLVRQFVEGDCDQIASSRLEQLYDIKMTGIQKPLLLVRIPMPCEVPNVVSICDITLVSEVATMEALNEECLKQNKKLKVIVMADLGDLREGFWERDELVDACVRIETKMPGLELAGVGTNLGCYGSIQPTVEKMDELIAAAEAVEAAIGRQLEWISGGATSSFVLVNDGVSPSRINHLRIGENILLGRDLQVDWKITNMQYLRMDAFTLKAQVIEVKNKPSHPVGKIFMDAFGNFPTYVDRGIRRRALLGLGKLDLANIEKLIPREEGIEVLGGSSDHTILDIEDYEGDLKVGDILEFDLCYNTLLFLTSSRSVILRYFEGEQEVFE